MKEKISVSIDESLDKRLRVAIEETGESFSSVINKILKDSIEEIESMHVKINKIKKEVWN